MSHTTTLPNLFFNRFYRIMIFPSLILFLILGYIALTNPIQPTVELSSPGYALWVRIAGAFITAPISIILGWLITCRERQNLIGPVIIIWGCATNAELGVGYLPPFWAALSGFFLGAIANPGLALMLASFPSGVGVTSFWDRAMTRLTLLFMGLSFLRLLSSPYPYGLVSPNPFAVESLIPLNPIITGVSDFYLLGLLLLAICLGFYRHRITSETERKQLRWLLLVGLYYMLLAVLGFSLDWGAKLGEFGVVLFSVLGLVALSMPSIMISIAILFHRLWDIDIIIRRTLQYALLTGLLVLMYFGGVLILQRTLTPLTGSGNSPLVTVITTLGIVMLFNPLRIRIQNFIDRRFYRQKYDAEHALAKFATSARDEVDITNLTAALLGVVEDTIQPEKVSLWLRESEKVGSHE